MSDLLSATKQKLAEIAAAAISSPEPIELKSPPPHVTADFSLSVFAPAKRLGKNPSELAVAIADALNLEPSVESASANGGFVNITLNRRRFTWQVIHLLKDRGAQFGAQTIGAGKTVVVDFSAPNIAKPFNIGHLRSTIIGQALINVFRELGYTVIGDNHIGDWGTQFGKLMYAFTEWGNETEAAADPVKYLLTLYTRFHEAAEVDPSLKDAARAWFKRLENGDPEAVRLWTWFRDVSLAEFERIYELLGGIRFDEVLGESFYNDRLAEAIQETIITGLAIWNEVPDAELAEADEIPGSEAATDQQLMKQSALVIPVETLRRGTSPELQRRLGKAALMVQTQDGRSLYATRDLATVKYRVQRWHPDQIIYVVGGEQQLYFLQWFAAARLLGHIHTKLVHVWFGLYRTKDPDTGKWVKMSTRAGRVVFLEDVLQEAMDRVDTILMARRSDGYETPLSEIERSQIARAVGIGAIKYADLSKDRTNDVNFDWETIFNFSGNSGPYLQYAVVRIRSLLQKAGAIGYDPNLARVDAAALEGDAEFALIKTIVEFPAILREVAEAYAPHLLTTYLFRLAQEFSVFYEGHPIIHETDEVQRDSRLFLCAAVELVLVRGLTLLGISCPEKM